MMDDWQPISEATVGDQVLAYRDDARRMEVIKVEHCKDHMMYAYSHWMPLPDKPEIIRSSKG
jgi:hypothetical protein